VLQMCLGPVVSFMGEVGNGREESQLQFKVQGKWYLDFDGF